PELRARISDVLWLVRHDHEKARFAIEAYLESAKILEDPESWPPAADRIERALRLALSLQNNTLIDKVVSQIEEILRKYQGADPKFFTSKLMRLLLEIKRGNPEEYIPIASKVAKDSLSAHDW